MPTDPTPTPEDLAPYTMETADGRRILNWTAYSRENIPKPDHRFAVGDIVTVTFTTEIDRLTRDCDGAPLYSLLNLGHGFGEECIRLATEEEKENY
jgi:hypothetical protein